MAGRRSVWSDPEVVALAKRFVPCTDEVWRLQRGTDPECRLFRSMADGGHYRGKGGTRQGIYVATPAGRLLGSMNSLRATDVADLLRRGLDAWDALPEAERIRSPDVPPSPDHRWESSEPVDGLVLVSVVRDLPADLVPGAGTADEDIPAGAELRRRLEEAPRGSRWNRDYAWFTADEARRLVPDEPRAGERYEVPQPLVARLARFHLVDNVIGQTLPFAESEVEGSQLFTQVEAVRGSAVHLRLTGTTRAVAEGPWLMGENDWTPRAEWPRGLVTKLLGFAVYDLGEKRFTHFELVSQGLRWGRSQFNGRRDDAGPSPVGHVFRLAPETPRIPPAFVDVYDADWIVPPRGS